MFFLLKMSHEVAQANDRDGWKGDFGGIEGFDNIGIDFHYFFFGAQGLPAVDAEAFQGKIAVDQGAVGDACGLVVGVVTITEDCAERGHQRRDLF